MGERPYTVLSCGTSIDGYLDNGGDQRLVLSNEADLDRVDAVRASCDAILVGAATVRNDNPRLLVRDHARRQERVGRGLKPSPMKVTVTSRAELDDEAQFFTTGDCAKLIYCASPLFEQATLRFGQRSTVIDGGDPVDMTCVSEDLYRRGVRRLMVEGGGTVLTQFLTEDLADELQLVIAPLFVGNSGAHRFVGDGTFPWNPGRRAILADVQRIEDVVLLRYALSERFSMGRC